MYVLMITSEWPTKAHPEWASFIVKQVEGLIKTGINVEVFSFRGRKNPINYFTAWRRLQKLLRSKKFDLIHAQFGQSGILTFSSKLPWVVTFHGSDLEGYVSKNGNYTVGGKLLNRISRFVSKRAKEVILVSRSLARCLPAGLPYHVIPCGIDLDFFHPVAQSEARKKLGLSAQKRIILFVSPQIPVKRFDLAQKAVDLIKDRFDTELITLSGVSPDSMRLYLNAADVLLLTSKHEGSPTILKEALACNLPVVAIRAGDIEERIKNLEGCIICQDDSALTISKALTSVLSVPKRIHGRDRVSHLGLDSIEQNIAAVYRKVLEERR